MTLNPSKSKNGGAARGDPAFTFNTISQRLDCKGRPLYICGAIAITSPYSDQKEQSCCLTIKDAITGTFISFTGTYVEGVPVGGTGCTVKCLQVKGEERKSCCASLLAKQTSNREMSAWGTIPTAEVGRLAMISKAQPCLYIEGRGMNIEYQEEEGGKRWGAANCSKSTAHSVGRNGRGFFFAATCAHVGVAAMV